MRKTISRRIRRRANGIDVAADVNAVVVTNSGPGTHQASSRQEVTIRQGGDEDEASDEASGHDEPGSNDEERA